ncbi:class I tRNA ligase family protein [Candidatus Carsonella ruddii]|uniref:leucine--tRNA ligase n=1 Tax=Candidatus Carsonella ruddii (Diaphorina cf. continua) TaxID=2661587 RepID=A0A7R7AC35_CARRU|nr:class I tRNA ligase family protein [Candidatus Carsonella ruddii (Diaphorina cf. continua)]BCG49335.1 leucine--tRNA ligase [Candidatus Carsonella ruddii (Diaphorina cf. continua)]
MKYFKNPIFIEKKITKKIKQVKKNRFFSIPMFPYPSGKLHLGHVRNYVLTDIITKIKQLEKNNVIHSLGWDSFGLPAENASKKYNINSLKWTISNIKLMRHQLKLTNIDYYKKTEFLTCDFNFYKWEFWIFIHFLKNNLLYKSYENVYWDEIENCILSNEQVINNICWRSGIKAETRRIKTWFINIKKYTKRLIFNLRKINWSKKVKNIQKKWINILIFFIKKNHFYSNYNNIFININFLKIKNNNLLYLIVLKNFKNFIFKKKIFIFDKKLQIKKKIILNNFKIINSLINKKNLNLLIFKKNIFYIKITNIKNWSFERNRLWGSFFFYKKVKNKNFKSKSTIDTFFQSSWYYINYLKTKNLTNLNKLKWFPINIYIGGIEHVNLHLIYLRIINNIFYDLNILKNKEIIFNLINQGFINNKVFYKFKNLKKIFCKKTKNCIYSGIEKMSKSKKNGVNPVPIIIKYGSDLLRLSIITNKPVYKNIIWEDINFESLKKFIIKLHNLIILKKTNSKKIISIKSILNIKKIHNTISFVKKILFNNDSLKQIEIIVFWLFPIIPNISKILWFKIGNLYPIERFYYFNFLNKEYNLYIKNIFLKKIFKIEIKTFKVSFIIKKIKVSMDEISILLN